MAFDATDVQVRLMDYIRDGQYRIIGFGGGIRGTKTWGGTAAILTLCRVFPRSRWAIVRKTHDRLRDNWYPSFSKLREEFGAFVGDVNWQTRIAKCSNGSEIILFPESLQSDTDLSRWKGLEVNGFLLEEADELADQSYVKAQERAGAWIVPPGYKQPPPYILATFNPCSNWPRRVFYEPWKDKTIAAPYAFVPATAADNPYISDLQRQAWKDMPEDEYRRFVIGDWEVLTGRFYGELNRPIHVIPRDRLPDPLPNWWEYWGSYDWGFGHWAVFGAWARDKDGNTFLLDSCWMRQHQDDDQANTIVKVMPQQCLQEVYAGHDCWGKFEARGASGISTASVFDDYRIGLIHADIDLINGGRAVRRALKIREGRAGVYLVDTPGNIRVFNQLAEIMPDENNADKPAKVDCDTNGNGGDDGADMFRYGLATRYDNPKEPYPTDAMLHERRKLDALSRHEAEQVDKYDRAAEREARRLFAKHGRVMPV